MQFIDSKHGVTKACIGKKTNAATTTDPFPLSQVVTDN